MDLLRAPHFCQFPDSIRFGHFFRAKKVYMVPWFKLVYNATLHRFTSVCPPICTWMYHFHIYVHICMFVFQILHIYISAYLCSIGQKNIHIYTCRFTDGYPTTRPKMSCVLLRVYLCKNDFYRLWSLFS